MHANDQQCLCIHIYMYICMYVCVLHHLRKQLAASNAGTPASTVSQQRWHDSRTKATSSQQCWHTRKHCQPATLARQQNESNQQPAMLAHQQALSASNAGTTAELTQKTLSQQLAANILCHTFFHRFCSNGFSLDAKSHASKFGHTCLVVSLDNFIQ